MTVAELIEELMKYDKEAEVLDKWGEYVHSVDEYEDTDDVAKVILG